MRISTYVLSTRAVLFSMAYVDNVSYVAGFRQLSIPIGALLGMIVLRESLVAPKIVGVLGIFSGLVMIAFG